MSTSAAAPTRRGARAAAIATGLVLSGVLISACGGDPAPTAASVPAAPTTTADPALRAYCDTVARVQAEQSSPQAGQGGVQKAGAAARKQVDDLVATAPPEIAADWRTVQRLTDQGLDSLARTGGDPEKIDHDELTTLRQQAEPAVAHIKSVTEQRCHTTFRAPGS